MDCIGNKNGMGNSTISVLEALVYLTCRQERNPRLGREPHYLSSRMLKITSFLAQESKQ
nr:hypothetical protein [Elizabethkingia sp. ASV34]